MSSVLKVQADRSRVSGHKAARHMCASAARTFNYERCRCGQLDWVVTQVLYSRRKTGKLLDSSTNAAIRTSVSSACAT